MAEDPPHADSGDSTARRGSRPGTPRWVKVLGLMTLVLVLLVVAVNLATGGGHGPGRHLGGDPPTSHISQQHQP